MIWSGAFLDFCCMETRNANATLPHPEVTAAMMSPQLLPAHMEQLLIVLSSEKAGAPSVHHGGVNGDVVVLPKCATKGHLFLLTPPPSDMLVDMIS